MEICPFYEELDKIFCKNRPKEANVLVESSAFNVEALFEYSSTSTSVEFVDVSDNADNMPLSTPETPSADLPITHTTTLAPSPVSPTAPLVATVFTTPEPSTSTQRPASTSSRIGRGRKKNSNSLEELITMETKRDEYRLRKIVLEEQKFEHDRETTERKIKLEEEKLRIDSEIRVKEIESKERIALYELNLKYKNNS